MADESRPIRARATELHGSNAGAGSGALTVYRKHRRLELERLDKLDRTRLKEEERARTEQVLKENAAADEARVEKNRRKRQRRKGSKQNDKEEEEDKDELEEEEAKALLEMAEEELKQAKES